MSDRSLWSTTSLLFILLLLLIRPLFRFKRPELLFPARPLPPLLPPPSGCRPCDPLCRTCFGPGPFSCLSCFEEFYVYLAKGKTCIDRCGDGVRLNNSALQCDDGNLINGDGCSSTCMIERGWKCESTGKDQRNYCYEVCGDGRRIKEACDDNNKLDGDGCSA